MNKLLIVFGTRPELIKLFPVIHQFKSLGMRNRLIIIDTGQHADLIEEDLRNFDILPDHRLKALKKGQSIQSLTTTLLSELEKLLLVLKNNGEDIAAVLAQGDTNTTFAAGLTAFYNNLPFLHLEAGLRTNDLYNPYPEEFNRKAVDMLAHAHYAPTITAKNHLLKEGVSAASILVTGNTGVDALTTNISGTYCNENILKLLAKNKSIVLITSHRRENKRELHLLFNNINKLAEQEPEHFFLWLTHPGNTIIKEPGTLPANFETISPVDYVTMLHLYKHIQLIITDSGGMQEEAASFGIPSLVLRNKTEREESIESGISKLIGFSFELLEENFRKFIEHKNSVSTSPYGDGKAAIRVVEHIRSNYLLE